MANFADTFADTFCPQSPDFALFDPVSLARIKGREMREVLILQGFIVAGELGFEPRQTESESVVLPLHHSPITSDT